MGIDKLDKVGSEIPARENASSDRQAEREAKFFGDKHRAEQSKQTLHVAFIWFVRVATFVFIGLFIVRMLHFGFPEHWCWLSEQRIKDIDKLLFGALAGFVMNYLKPMLPDSPSERPGEDH